MGNVISVVCKCLGKFICTCASFWTAPSRKHTMRISQRDLEEWKRVEGVDQYVTTKRPWS